MWLWIKKLFMPAFSAKLERFRGLKDAKSVDFLENYYLTTCGEKDEDDAGQR